MNEKIVQMIDLLFRDVETSEEVRALREEVLNNCQDRYEDLIRGGVNEEEALAAVMESLKGMEEVLREYPRKGESAGDDGAAEAETEAQEKEEEKAAPPREVFFAPEQVKTLETRLNSCDVKAELSDGDRIEVERTEDVFVELKPDGTLLISQESTTDQLFGGISWKSSLNSFASFGEAMDQLAQNVGRVVTRGFSKNRTESRVRIRIPAAAHPAARIRTTCGSIGWKDAVPGEIFSAQTTSGSVRVELDESYLLPEVKIGTVSGDVDADLSAEKVALSTISGDISWNGRTDRLELSTTSGDVDAVCAAGEIVLNTTSGDVALELRDDAPAKVAANSVSGDVSLRVPGSVRKVSAQLKSLSGEVRTRGVENAEDAEIRIESNTVSGDLKVYN